MTIVQIFSQGNVPYMLLMAVIIAGILAMMLFFYRELKKTHGEIEKKNDQSVGSAVFSTQQSGNSAVIAAISAAVNEYRKN